MASCKCWGQPLAVLPTVWFAAEHVPVPEPAPRGKRSPPATHMLQGCMCLGTKQTSEEFPVRDNSCAWAGN